MWSVGWPAPAKINLFLHVTGRRADGYHELQTLFQFLDTCDGLAFRLRSDGAIRRVFGTAGISEEDDLAVHAARRLQARAGVPQGADIAVTKRLPAGGGLGGGSSDAATTLLALNRLWGAGLYPRHLLDLALELGADVPVFVAGRASWAEGVGEALTAVEPRESWYLLIIPPVEIPTVEVFGAPELTRDCPPIKIRDFLARGAGNVCETPVRRRFPVVAQALDWLAGQGVTPRLSGTGACVFGAFPEEEPARNARAAALRAGWRAWVTHGLNRSPLATRLSALEEG